MIPAENWAQINVWIWYTNWKGVTRWRNVVPLSIWFGCTQWHPENGWMLKAIDVEAAEQNPDLNAERDFCMKDIHKWQAQPPQDEKT